MGKYASHILRVLEKIPKQSFSQARHEMHGSVHHAIFFFRVIEPMPASDPKIERIFIIPVNPHERLRIH